jgi:IS605 OrfB family transposase
MEVISSYNCKITNGKDIFKPTIEIYRRAITYLIEVVNDEYAHYINLTIKEKVNYTEKLVHMTEDNPCPKYSDFDKLFYKFPSYLRRDAISQAVGIVSSYRSNLANYEAERYNAISNGKRFKKKPPKLQLKHYKCPTLFKGNMFERISDNKVMIKIFHRNDWVWFDCNLRQQDVKYILSRVKTIANVKELSPTLCGSNRKYYLKFSFKRKVYLPKPKLKEQVIVSVDLGMNNTAVCSAMNVKGTVLGRLFINQPKEKDRQRHLLNKVCKAQYQSGKHAKIKSLWRKINNLNTQIANDTVNKIISFAIKYGASCIVFEYLGKMPKFKGKKNKRLRMQKQLWIYRRIQNKVYDKAHFLGIRVRHINPRNTSALAYDGSGRVTRNTKNHSICTFKNGKQYNCDLSASYNIGARYFINEILQSSTEKKRSELEAKVPEVLVRTNCVLSTLISVAKAL